VFTAATRLSILAGIAVAAIAAAWLLPPMPQPAAYHAFADQRTLLGIPNVFDVLSNVPFLLIGVAGLVLTVRLPRTSWADPAERWAWIIFFLGVALTGPGSAYYHWAPDNERLAWDRLPLTVTIVALIAALLIERVDVRIGRLALVPLVLTAVATVFLWLASERAGHGNLVPYVVLHVAAIVCLFVIAFAYPPRHAGSHRYLVLTMVSYAAAKVCELFDAPLYAIGHVVSGHTLKHLFAALASYWLYSMLRERSIGRLRNS
jgi:hypothetical protein